MDKVEITDILYGDYVVVYNIPHWKLLISLEIFEACRYTNGFRPSFGFTSVNTKWSTLEKHRDRLRDQLGFGMTQVSHR